MKLYNEVKLGRRSCYEKVLLDEGGEVISRRRSTSPLFTSIREMDARLEKASGSIGNGKPQPKSGANVFPFPSVRQ